MGEHNLGDLLLLAPTGRVNSIVEGLNDETLQNSDAVLRAPDVEYNWTAGAEAY